MVDNAFIQTLKSTADQNAMKLNLVRCANRDHIKLDDLVLILCECRTGEYLTNIFGDIKKKEIESKNHIHVSHIFLICHFNSISFLKTLQTLHMYIFFLFMNQIRV